MTAAATSFSLSVLTHDDPVGAVDATLTRIGPVVGDVGVDVEHDTGCPAIAAGHLIACTCEVVRLIVPWEGA